MHDDLVEVCLSMGFERACPILVIDDAEFTDVMDRDWLDLRF